MGGGGEILELLASEDVDGNQVNLGVTVLSSLGGRHVDNLARAALDNDMAVLTQSRALHGEGQRRAGVGRLEGVIMLEKKLSVNAAIRHGRLLVVDGCGLLRGENGGRGVCVWCVGCATSCDAGCEFALATNSKSKRQGKHEPQCQP